MVLLDSFKALSFGSRVRAVRLRWMALHTPKGHLLWERIGQHSAKTHFQKRTNTIICIVTLNKYRRKTFVDLRLSGWGMPTILIKWWLGYDVVFFLCVCLRHQLSWLHYLECKTNTLLPRHCSRHKTKTIEEDRLDSDGEYCVRRPPRGNLQTKGGL